MRSLILTAIGAVILGGCNTVAGVGKDISAAGRGVTGAAVYMERQLSGQNGRSETSMRFRQSRYLDGQVITGRPCDPDNRPGAAPRQGLPACNRASVTYASPLQRDNR